MRSPFKFLDAYTYQDGDIFFGRGKEVEALYQMVFKSSLMLVYGYSGTGKTSLIQCGLANRFKGPDWLPFFIRRGENINKSLHATLDEYLIKGHEVKLVEKINYLNIKYFRPVYLIFDQFEELFIRGNFEEQKVFLQNIQDLLDADLQCRIIFVIREEFLGELYHYEKALPFLYDFKLRVEPMRNVAVKKMMTSSFKKFNISLEPPEEDRLQAMLDNFSEEKSNLQLPYLQVYLDLLYRESEKLNAISEKVEGNHPSIEFTQKNINSLGKIENVLDKFLIEQSADLERELTIDYQGIPIGVIFAFLDAFVTPEGTKRPIYYERKEDSILLITKIFEYLPAIPKSVNADIFYSDCIEGLEKRRIIRFLDNDAVELAHDSLAQLIDQKRTDEQRKRAETLQTIKNHYREYQKIQKHLSEKQLILYDDFIKSFPLESSILHFIEESRKNVKKLKAEEKKRQEREIEIAEKMKTAKRRKQLSWAIGVLAIVAIFFGVIARKAKKELAINTRDRIVEGAEAFKALGQMDSALVQAREAYTFASSHNIELAEEIDTLKWKEIKSLMYEAEAALAKEDPYDMNLISALNLYRRILEIETDNGAEINKKDTVFVFEKTKNLEQITAKSFEVWLTRSINLSQYAEKSLAKKYLEISRKLYEPLKGTQRIDSLALKLDSLCIKLGQACDY